MDRSTPTYLISETYTTDTIGQHIAVPVERKVYASVDSVSRAEWSAAGELGLRPEYKLTMFEPDYKGEKIVRMSINGSAETFGVYRTYRGKNEQLELYVEHKVGNAEASDGN